MNKVLIVGRLTKDVELKVAQNGNSYCNFTVAVNNGKDKQGKELPADYLPCSVFGKIAENTAQCVGKGSLVCVEGRLKLNNKPNGDGTYSNYTSVVVDKIDFLSYKNNLQGVPTQAQPQQYAPQQPQPQQMQQQAQYAPQQQQMQQVPQQQGFTPAGDFNPEFGFDPALL